MLNPGTWVWVMVTGGMVTVAKIALDLRDMRRAGAVWRKMLIQSFGGEMRGDAEAARQARLAIEFRVRLAEAEATAPRAAQARLADVTPDLDIWVERIVDLARKVAGLRGEARFQAGLASRTRARLAEIEARAATDAAQASRLAETAGALRAQVRALDAFAAFVEDGFLQLEHAVGVFSAAASQIVLDLSRGETTGAGKDLRQRIGTEIAGLEQNLDALDRLDVPLLAAPGVAPGDDGDSLDGDGLDGGRLDGGGARA
jgi:hypothetical protein